MSQLQVLDINVPNLLKKLKTQEWLVPQFQREFVWSNAAVISLVNSIIDARPVGMITLWEQQENSPLVLEPVSIPDWIPEQNRTGLRNYSDDGQRPGRYYAVLDGRQRSTALALVFGGLRAEYGNYRHAGAYFIDVTARDDTERVKFISQKDIGRRNIGTLAGAISKGLFPLAVDDPDRLIERWMSFLQSIYNRSYYSEGTYPADDELERRNKVLSKAFSGIINTKLAVYVVPSDYDLADICDIFETLNTTGTKVSPVDLIHSGLFNDTLNDVGGPLLLRDAIDALGELDGAIGWASSKERPELIAQFVAASYIASDNKLAPRRIGGVKGARLTSVKSGDLLAIPSGLWRQVFENSSVFASFIGGFQTSVAGGPFSMARCPYPASAAIYVALRWFLEFDAAGSTKWTIEQLDRVYRAFFWRNVLQSRYDQGFLTKIGTDIRDMKSFLQSSRLDASDDYWRTQANLWLDGAIGTRPELSEVVEIVSDGDEKGALRRASLLLLYSRASKDVANTDLAISLGSEAMELHHIYPRDWCSNNSAGPLKRYLDKDVAGRDWVNSAANLLPMHRRTNNEWRKKSPRSFLEERAIDYDTRSELWARYFITRDMFDDLAKGEEGLPGFLEKRARLISEEIVSRCVV